MSIIYLRVLILPPIPPSLSHSTDVIHAAYPTVSASKSAFNDLTTTTYQEAGNLDNLSRNPTAQPRRSPLFSKAD